MGLTFHGVPDSHGYSILVSTVRKLIGYGDWHVELSQVYREANCYADKLGKQGQRLLVGVAFFDRLPTFASLQFLADMSGHNIA